MTQITSVDETRKIVPTASSKELISRGGPPWREEEKDYLRGLIKAESREVGVTFKAGKFRLMVRAQAAVKRLQAICEDRAARRAEAEQYSRASESGNLAYATIFSACAASCFWAEFTLNRILCFILSIEETSWEGYAVALAPATAVIVLDVVIARLFEDPWRAMRSGTASRATKWTALALMTVFLLGVAALNGLTAWRIADAREAGFEMLDLLKHPDAIARTLDSAVVGAAVRLVTFAVIVDGAIFMLLGLFEARLCWQRWRARLAATAATQEHIQAHAEFTDAEAQVKIRQDEYEKADAEAELMAERYQQEGFKQLAEADKRRRLSQPVSGVVTEILAATRPAQDLAAQLTEIKAARAPRLAVS